MSTTLIVWGKGAKDRAVPIKGALAADINAWGEEIGADGFILRSLGRGNRLGERLTTAYPSKIQSDEVKRWSPGF